MPLDRRPARNGRGADDSTHSSSLQCRSSTISLAVLLQLFLPIGSCLWFFSLLNTMRITADLLQTIVPRLTPLRERELSPRGLGIAAIENLSAAGLEWDVLDLTDNRLTVLENLAPVPRISSLFCGGNLIDRVDAENVAKNLPHLKYLLLCDNRLASLVAIEELAQAAPKLEVLSLRGNPVTRTFHRLCISSLSTIQSQNRFSADKPHYRLFCIASFPHLKVLDFAKVTHSERHTAESLVKGKSGAALQQSLEAERLLVTTDNEPEVVVTLSEADKNKIRELLLNAKTAKEIEEIERMASMGKIRG